MRSNTYPRQFKVKLVVTFTVGVISSLVAGSTIFLYIKYDKLRDVLAFSATALATAAAVTGASYVAQDLKHNAEASLFDRTLSYIERWNNSAFDKQKIIGLMRELKERNDIEKEKHLIEELKKDSLKSELICILNFLEEMSLAVSRGLVDEALLKDFFRGIVKIYVETFKPWMKLRAEQTSRDAIYINLRDLYASWEGNGTSP